MPPNKKHIPLEDIRGLTSFMPELNEEKITIEEIAEYYSQRLPYPVGRMTISRRIQELRESEK